MPLPVAVKAKQSQTIYLEYKDGLKGEIDLTKTINNNSYDDLKDPSEFSKVFIDKKSRDICWPCGVTLCKNALYSQLELRNLIKRLKIDVDKGDV